MLSKPLDYSSNVFNMFLECSAEDNCVVEVGNVNAIADTFQGTRTYSQRPMGDKCSLVLVVWVYKTLMTGFSQVEKRERRVLSKVFQVD